MAKIHISTVLNATGNGITKYVGLGILKNNELVFYENDVRVIVIISDDVLAEVNPVVSEVVDGVLEAWHPDRTPIVKVAIVNSAKIFFCMIAS